MVKKLNIVLLIIFLWGSAALSADKSATSFKGTAIGIAAAGGPSHAFAVKDSNFDWNLGVNISGGLVFEKMFTNRWGIHTGFWTRYSRLWFKEDSLPIDASFEMMAIDFPLDVIISFNAGFFSFNILTGMTFSAIIDSWVDDKTTGSTADFLYSTNQFQMALDLGCTFKFRVGTYTDLFFGMKAHFYVLPLMDDFKGEEDNFTYDAHMFGGIMFRTTVFPF